MPKAKPKPPPPVPAPAVPARKTSPGPWRWTTTLVMDPAGRTVLRAGQDRYSVPGDETLGNMQLAAAAPTMRAAIEAHLAGDPDADNLLRSALRKAGGECDHHPQGDAA